MNARELFKFLSLQINVHWDSLIWMDSANFGGIVCANPLVEPPLHTGEDDPKLPVELYFNIEDFLPVALRPQFKAVLRRFVRGLYGCHLRSGDVARTPLRVMPNATQGSVGSVQKPMAVDGKQALQEAEIRKDYIAHAFTKFYLEGLEALREHEKYADPSERALWRFDAQPGSYLMPSNAILEFIKSTTAVFALAKDVSVEVGILKRNVLDIIGVREYVFAFYS